MRNISEDMINITVSKERINFFTKRLDPESTDQIFSILKDVNGSFQISWVAESISKRKIYSNSRAKNRTKKEENQKEHVLTHDNICKHMENANENEIINENKDENKKGGTGGKKEPDFIDQVLKKFQEAYKNEHGFDYELITPGKERKAVGQLLKNYKDNFPQAKSDETLDGMADFFNKAVKIQDKWLHDHISPTMIVSKFNDFKNILKNGKGNIDFDYFENAAKEFGDLQRRLDAERKKRAAGTE